MNLSILAMDIVVNIDMISVTVSSSVNVIPFLKTTPYLNNCIIYKYCLIVSQ